ncbi:putative 3-hydroxyisobutyrate dehydrogenase [Bradyrhizobium sp. ORS 285]|uniref:NAD(P)-dependent oxidoreductase n=1 Tax=Bradyrhizobium sp. ORS 285 TaxID=115808 RepID=UPI0002408512|nr:NAD(P)-dependent oxidoreductase [Bradyrhizobium sp. ORS 285]CCD90332.1 putative 3-hydroxyisobutyrate dehydrogenase [Bradyrhizobium sp. ORS 285]SMX57825.1 putative 3-hydroxyisobutyrate dehydrogenase [Bradyrhizobium sp. ORS 285]
MTAVGIIGLGNMGRGMALTLKGAGFAVTGYDASETTCAALAAEGLSIADGIGPLVAAADMIILSLPTAEIVERVVADGILAHARPGVVIVDTSTSHPETSRRLAALLKARGMGFVDAPVSGGPKGAAAGSMTMVIGAEDDDLARVLPVLEKMSAKRVHVGGVGAGNVAKIVNNLLCAAHLLTAAEALRIAGAAGVDAERLLDGLNAGSGRSGVTQVNVPNWILNGAFDSGFTMQLMRKDVRLAAQFIGELGLALPMAADTARIWADSAGSIADPEDFNRIVELQLGPISKT